MPGESFYTAPKALEHVSALTYETDFPELKWREQIPLNTSVSDGAEFYAFVSEEIIGDSKVSHTYANSAPSVDVKTTKSSYPIVPLLSTYHYSIQDIRNASLEGRDLPARKGIAAREIVERGLDELFFMGSAKHNVSGMLNHSDVTQFDAVDPGSGTTWSTKTADEKITDITSAVSAMQDATNGREGNVVDILLPHVQFTDLATERVSDTGMTALAYIMGNIPLVRSIRSNYRLKDIEGTDDRMVLYNQDSSKLEAILPLDVLIHAAQQNGAIWDTLIESRAAGTVLYKPRSMYYVDKI